MLRLIAALWLALFALPAVAQNFPALTGRVVDQANLLRPEQKVDLDSKLSALEAQSGRQFVVATVTSLEGREIDEYAYLLGRHWKIGDEKSDDGAVMVVAPKERKVFIATGYGAGGYLTDSVTGRIIREAVLPRFKAGDMGGGIIAGADRVIEIMKLPPEEAVKQAQQTAAQDKQRGRSGAGFIPVIFMAVIFFMLMIGRISRGGGKKYRSRRSGGGIDPLVVLWGLEAITRASRGGGGGWGGGGFGGGGFGGGGGGFSGGGGSFGGGGAGGSW